MGSSSTGTGKVEKGEGSAACTARPLIHFSTVVLSGKRSGGALNHMEHFAELPPQWVRPIVVSIGLLFLQP